MDEGESLTVEVDCFDIDEWPRELRLQADGLPPGASFIDEGDGRGEITYSPEFDTVVHPQTQKVFRVAIMCFDGRDADTDWFLVTVNDVNQVPVAQNGSATTDEDASVGITLLCTDPDRDSVSFNVASNPANGSLSGSPPEVTYSPTANFNGNDSFTFNCSDGALESNIATVFLTVNSVNDPPVLIILGNQTVAEGTSTDLINFAACTDVDTLTLSALVPSFASFTDSGDGTGDLELSPGFADSGSYPNNSVTCSDSQGGSDTKTFQITVNNVNQAPMADAGGPYECNIGDIITLSSADSNDPDGSIVLFEWDLDDDGIFETTGASPSYGCISYDPFLILPAAFTVKLRVTDNDGATAEDSTSVTINP